MSDKKFKILEVSASSEGCQVALYYIPDDVELIVLSNLGDLLAEIETMLNRFSIEVSKHNAKILNKSA